MDTLLIRLQAPMQSWGVSSNFTTRDTTREPTKSGVIGLICAALGRPRDADLTDLAALKMGVRVDREGVLQKDYQIAQNVLTASGKKTKASEPSNRYYLADAAFLAGLQGPRELLEEIHRALYSPHWTLYFGRKAFPPGKPVWLKDGLFEGDILQAFGTFPCLVPDPPETLRVVLESDTGQFARADVPVNFAERRFSSRRVAVLSVKAPRYEEV